MASPIVAGAAALVKAVNPNLQPRDIENILSDSSDKYRELSALVEDGNYLNLKDAVTLARTYKPTPNEESVFAEVSVPIDKKWANRLWKWSGKDGVVNVYIDNSGDYKRKSRKISESHNAFYLDLFEEIKEVTGLMIASSEIKKADIIIHSTGKGRGNTKKRIF